MLKKKVLTLLVLSLVFASLEAKAQSNGHRRHRGAGTTKVEKNPDADLSHAPESYRKRISAFRALIRRETTHEAKIKKALSLAQNPKSPYRVDALNFLAETKSKEAVPSLILIAKDPEVREFAIFALGESASEDAIPVLIHNLSDRNENVRGNAQRALTKITRFPFKYQYSGTEKERIEGIKEIEQWWSQNKATFKVREQTPEEKKEMDEAWEKYGRQYIEDLSR